ncbi:MAG: hypothetical protein IPN19_10780 [Elusimicrobia bacterium]|nr:hypothetical protein [Elusimicrobiota bacterium]
MSEKSSDGKRDVPTPKDSSPRINARKLDKLLSAICKAGGMTGGPLSDFLRGGGAPAGFRSNAVPPPSGKRQHLSSPGHSPSREGEPRFQCQGPCVEAEWRAHLDIPEGLLCLSAAWSRNTRSHRHRDVTIGVNFLDKRGRPRYEEMTFCDSEIRWIMETLWHAPIWD